MKSWTHPNHAKGIRSAGIPTLRGKKLTDSRIAHYILLGYYGKEKQDAALAAQKKKAVRKKEKTPVEQAMELLNKLL